MKAVIGYVREHSVPGAILRAWSRDEFELVISQHILGELSGVFSKPYFRSRFSPEELGFAMATLRSTATVVPITTMVEGVASHAEDDLVLATAVSGDAEFVVTGDRELVQLRTYQAIAIVTPREFLDRIPSE